MEHFQIFSYIIVLITAGAAIAYIAITDLGHRFSFLRPLMFFVLFWNLKTLVYLFIYYYQINLSVAIWVGFLALFGIASDDGVIMGTYINDIFRQRNPKSRKEIHEAVIAGGTRRIRACLMTTGTTILALIPVLTSTGRGSDIMVPMAIPSFGGMLIEVLTLLIVPVLYALTKELSITFSDKTDRL